MTVRKRIKYVHEGEYVAAVEVELVDDDAGWSPYLSLDDVREALKREDLAAAAQYGEVFHLERVET